MKMSEQDNLGENIDQQNSASEATFQRTSVLQKIKNAPKRTKLIAGGIAGVVLLSGGAGAYAVYQSPDTVVAQALVSLVTASNPSYELDLDGSTSGLNGNIQLFTYGSDKGTALELKIKAAVAGQDASATLNGVFSKEGDAYLNLSDFSTLATALQSTGYLPASAVQSYSAALTGTWVKLGSSDISQYTQSLGGASTCLNPSDTEMISKDIQGNLRSNFFIKVKEELSQEDGNRVFLLSIDAGKLRNFFSSLRTSQGFAALQKCQPGLAITDQTINLITQQVVDEGIAKSGTSVKLYANSFSHSFSKLTVEIKDPASGQAVNLTLKSNGSHPEKVAIPETTTTFNELLTKIYSNLYY
jgi:hypothetical protein